MCSAEHTFCCFWVRGALSNLTHDYQSRDNKSSAWGNHCPFCPKWICACRHRRKRGKPSPSVIRTQEHRCGVASLAFLGQILKFWLFLMHSAFLKNKKKQILSGFFQSERLDLEKALFELHIPYKTLLTRVYDHAGCELSLSQADFDSKFLSETYPCLSKS